MKLTFIERYEVYKLARKQYKRDCEYIKACIKQN